MDQFLEEPKEGEFENMIVRRLSIAHNRKYGSKDIYETVPFFQHVPNKRDRDDLKRALKQEAFHAGDILFNYQDIGDKFYIIMAGEVVIELPDPDMNRHEFNDQYAEYKLLLQ